MRKIIDLGGTRGVGGKKKDPAFLPVIQKGEGNETGGGGGGAGQPPGGNTWGKRRVSRRGGGG